MVIIDHDKCIQCGQCIRDCVSHNLALEENKIVEQTECLLCGHCIAVCPKGAVSLTEYDMSQVEEYTPEDIKVDPKKLLRVIKFRRSIRHYQDRLIEKEKVDMILEVARYTPTGKNTQGCRFVFVQEKLEDLKELIWSELGKILESDDVPRWAGYYQQFYDAKKANPKDDFIFRNTPAALFITAQNHIDGGLAAQNIELEAIALDLGMLYNGYLYTIVEKIPAVQKFLGIADRKIKVCALLGYPAVTYHRTVPRLPGDFIVM